MLWFVINRRRRLLAFFILLLSGVLLLFLARWSQTPVLEITYSPEAVSAIDWPAFEYPLREAGVARIELVEGRPSAEMMGETRGKVRIGVVLSDERNPALTPEMLSRGLTGPGYTVGRICYIYRPDVELFLRKHQATLGLREPADLVEARRRLITNTAVHEAWHAVTQSTSHNPTDVDSLMYMDPGQSPKTYCLDRPLFTRGHRDRLAKRFRSSIRSER